jgi:hypothetical protein
MVGLSRLGIWVGKTCVGDMDIFKLFMAYPLELYDLYAAAIVLGMLS